MLVLVILLAVATLASGVWSAVDALRPATPRPARISIAFALIALATVAGAIVRYGLIPPHHAMYVDEPWYAEAACNLARVGQLLLCETTWAGTECVRYGKAWGWPVLLAPLAWLVGCGTWIGIAVNRVLGSTGILLLAATVRTAGGSWWQAALAAALLAIHPVHAAWSVTGETNVPAATALLIGLCGALRFLRGGRASGAALAISALGLATAIRPESFAVAGVTAVAVAYFAHAPPSRRLAVAAAIVLASAAALAAAADLWTMNESISGGAFLSAANVARNLNRLTQAAPIQVHGVVVLTALIGAGLLARAKQWGTVCLLGGAAIAAALGVLTYDRFDERMLLAATVALLPLSGSAFGGASGAPFRHASALSAWIVRGIALAAIVLAWSRVLLASPPSETQRLETRIASRVGAMSVPDDVLFIAAQPTVLAASGIPNVMATDAALRDRARLAGAIAGGATVYFLCDMFCEPSFQAASGSSSCREIMDAFAMTPVVADGLHGRSYVLYRLDGTAGVNTPAPACPRMPPDHARQPLDQGHPVEVRKTSVTGPGLSWH